MRQIFGQQTLALEMVMDQFLVKISTAGGCFNDLDERNFHEVRVKTSTERSSRSSSGQKSKSSTWTCSKRGGTSEDEITMKDVEEQLG